MTIRPLTFGVQSSPGRWGHDGDNRLINAFAEDRGQSGKIRFPIVASPGLTLFGTATNGLGIRGMLPTERGLVVVAGTLVYIVDEAATFTQATGPGIPGKDPVFLAVNRAAPFPEVAIVVDGSRFVLDTDPSGPTVATIADADLPPPAACDFVDGYMLYVIADGRMFNSDLEDATTINALAFVTAEGSPDGLVSIGVRGREIFLFGEVSTEVWSNDGSNNPSPFARSVSQFIQKGIIGPHAVTKFQETLAFIDHEGTPRIMNGYAASKLGTPDQIGAVSRAIKKCSLKSSIVASSYTLEGNEWLQFTCPVGTGEPGFTWEFNATTSFWNERKSINRQSFRAAHAVRFDGKVLVGDVANGDGGIAANGKIYEVDPDAYDEAGEDMVFTMRAPIQHSYPGKLKFKTFYADLIPGVGLQDTGDDRENPLAMLRWSDDGAQSWSPTRNLPMGRIGETRNRIRTERLGRSVEDGRTWELSVSAAVVRGLTGAAVDIDQRKP